MKRQNNSRVARMLANRDYRHPAHRGPGMGLLVAELKDGRFVVQIIDGSDAARDWPREAYVTSIDKAREVFAREHAALAARGYAWRDEVHAA